MVEPKYNEIMIAKNTFPLLFIILIGVDFFGLFPRTTSLLLLPFALYFVSVTHNHKLIFKKNIFFYIFFASLSTITCYYYRGQSFFESFTCPAFREYYFLFLYFIFCYNKPKIEYVENIILKSFYIFWGLYMLQYILYPTKIIDILAGEGTNRFRIIGEIVNSLSYFICLNRFLLHGGNKNVIIMICSILVLFLQGFRAMLFAIVVASAIVYIKINGFAAVKKHVIMIFAITFLGILLSQVSIVKNSVERMIEANQTQTYSNDNYIRMVQLDYYMNSHFKSNIERFLGSGQPGYQSSYGKEMIKKGDNTDYEIHIKGGYLDWGLIGQSWMVGSITILIFYIMMFKCIYISWKSGKNNLYVVGWYIFLIIISFSNMEVHRTGSIVYHTLVFYIVTALYNKNEQHFILVKDKILHE